MSIIKTTGHEAGQTNSSTDPVPAVPSTTETVETTEMTEVADGPFGRSRRRPRLLVLAGLAVIGLAGVGYVALSGDDGQDTAAEPDAIRAVRAQQQDLVEFTDLDGTLGYAITKTVATATSGTITAVTEDGDLLSRGDQVYEIDAKPVPLFYGRTPLYRPLADGSEGDDVLLIEANLASLGYHLDQDADDLADGDDEVDTGFVVDGIYDGATADAVRRWQSDLGLEETGQIDVGDVVIAEGPAIASGPQVDIGTVVQPGSPIVDLNVTTTTDAFHSAHDGDLEFEAGIGPVTSGQVLYVIDDRPVTAIVTEEQFDRALSDGVADGDDVLALEQMLVAAGYDARGDLIPDDQFDEVTTEAIEDWQEDLQDTWDDVEVDGIVTGDDIVVVEPGTAVDSITDRPTDVVARGSELFTWTTADGGRLVTTTIAVSEQDKLTEGVAIDVEFPDGTIVGGTVLKVATSSTVDPTDPEAEAALAVEIGLDDVPASAAELNQLDVEVKLVENLVAGATVVPASALLATADSGYAVEVVDSDGVGTSVVPVEPGMFADGLVEVTGISPGTAVVVPS